jgi:DNA-binding transcriptional MerR regulator
MNNSFSQMAFNFGTEAEVPLSSPPVPLKGEEGVYVVGQENGYSGVRVRIKSLKNAKTETPKEEMPGARDTNEESLRIVKEPTPRIVKEESARVVELKLFDVPPLEVIKEEIAIPDEPVDSVSFEEEAGSMDDMAPAVDNVQTERISVPPPPPTEVSAPPAIVSRKVADPPVSDTQAPGSPGLIDAGTGSQAKPAKSKRGRKSLKQATAEADLIEVPGDDILFSKQYYTMRAVAEMFRVNQSLLRFWETEFDILQPRKNKKGDRYFRPVDIKNLHLIYHLLRQRKYTIEGAKEFLKKNKNAEERFEAIQRLQEIRAFLLEWKAQL